MGRYGALDVFFLVNTGIYAKYIPTYILTIIERSLYFTTPGCFNALKIWIDGMNITLLLVRVIHSPSDIPVSSVGVERARAQGCIGRDLYCRYRL